MNYKMIICEFYQRFLLGNKEKFDKTKNLKPPMPFKSLIFHNKNVSFGKNYWLIKDM